MVILLLSLSTPGTMPDLLGLRNIAYTPPLITLIAPKMGDGFPGDFEFLSSHFHFRKNSGLAGILLLVTKSRIVLAVCGIIGSNITATK